MSHYMDSLLDAERRADIASHDLIPAKPQEPDDYTGKRVRSCVHVLGKRVPMHVGIVTRDYGDGTCDVDRMSLHGGAPWVVRESKSDLWPEQEGEQQ